VFNTTNFKNISVISWWSVLLMQETRVPRKKHKCYILKIILVAIIKFVQCFFNIGIVGIV